MTQRGGRPEMSVLLVSPDGFGDVRRTVRALRRQTACHRLELVLIAPSRARLRLDERELQGFAAWRVVESGSIEDLPSARAAGVPAATADVIAFAENHCFPEPEWAEALLNRFAEGWIGVAPIMMNANPGTSVSGAHFLLDFGAWADPSGGEFSTLPQHNSAYRRDALLELGSDLASGLASEPRLQQRLAAKGGRFYCEPKARVRHVNASQFAAGMRVSAGRLYGAGCARDWSAARRLLYVAASPLIPLVRLVRLFRQCRRASQVGLLMRLLPSVVVVLLLDTVGEVIGFITGEVGPAARYLRRYELYRHEWLAPGEGDLLADPGPDRTTAAA